MGAKTMAQKVAWDGLNASLVCNRTDGTQLPMVPLFTWEVSRKNGGKFYGK